MIAHYHCKTTATVVKITVSEIVADLKHNPLKQRLLTLNSWRLLGHWHILPLAQDRQHPGQSSPTLSCTPCIIHVFQHRAKSECERRHGASVVPQITPVASRKWLEIGVRRDPHPKPNPDRRSSGPDATLHRDQATVKHRGTTRPPPTCATHVPSRDYCLQPPHLVARVVCHPTLFCSIVQGSISYY